MTTIDTEISQFPTPLPDRDNDTPNEFSDHVDNLLSHLPTFVGECNAWADEVNALTPEIEEANDRSNDLITSLAGTALSGTSSTTLTVETGSKTLTTGTGKEWVPGHRVKIAYQSDLTISMEGEVTSYDSSTGSLTVDVDSVSGSGSYSSWSIFTIPDVWSYKGARYYNTGAMLSQNGPTLLPMIFGAWGDAFQGKTIVSAEYWDGSSWVDWSSKIDELQNLLDGRMDSYAEISDTYKKFRFTINAGGDLSMGIVNVISWGRELTLTVETSPDQSTWTTRGAASYPSDQQYRFLHVALHDPNEIYWRVTLDYDFSGETIRVWAVRGLTGHALPDRTVYRGIPLYWDWKGQIGVKTTSLNYDFNVSGDIGVSGNLYGSMAGKQVITDLTAGEDLSACDPVAISSTDGKVYKFRSFSSSLISSLPETVYGDHIDIAVLDSTHIVMAYARSSDQYGRVVIGQVNSDKSISWGSAVTFNSHSTKYIAVAAMSSSSFVITYNEDNANDTCQIAGTVSGTSITLGSSDTISALPMYCKPSTCKLDSTNFVTVYARYDGSYTKTIVFTGTVSGTTITHYSGSTLEKVSGSDSDCSVSIAVLDSTHIAVNSRFSLSSGESRVSLCSVDTGTHSITEEDYISCDYRKGDLVAFNSTYFLGIYLNSGTLKLYLYSSDGSNLTEEDDLTVCTDAGSNYVSAVYIDSDRAGIIFVQNSKTKFAVVQRSNDSIASCSDTFDTYMSTSYLTLAERIDDTRFALISHSGYQIQDINFIYFGPIGFACSSITSGDTMEVCYSGILSGFSGLSPGGVYKINGDGDLVLANELSIETNFVVGMACSTTEVVIGLRGAS